MMADDAQKYSVPVQCMAGVYAGLSPQKDWDENVYLAKSLSTIVMTKKDEVWDDDMTKKGQKIWAPKKPPKVTPTERKNMAAALANAGKKYSQLGPPGENLFEKAVWVRTYDEAHNDRQFQHMSPDGGRWLADDGSKRRTATRSRPSGVAEQQRYRRQLRHLNPAAIVMSSAKPWATSTRCGRSTTTS
jgi:hypothetical protein